MHDIYLPWTRYPVIKPKHVVHLHNRVDLPKLTELNHAICYGNGRSYGDCCLTEGTLILTRGLDRFIAFDVETGVLRAEAGVMLQEVLQLAIPKGWFLPVTPGTQFVTLGGAVANDVHGKNHHRMGTFGCHVKSFELMRSNGERLICSAQENADFFAATIGGLGLTGIITWVELQLRAIVSPKLVQDTIRFNSLEEFFEINAESEATHEYTVAWVDCLSKGSQLGRGVFFRANHDVETNDLTYVSSKKKNPFLFRPPFSLINRVSLTMFNQLYWHSHPTHRTGQKVDYEPYFYPLDKVSQWNLMYGPKGFLQYQCVIPTEYAKQGIAEILKLISDSSHGSFLSVLKTFGDKKSPGMLSFPTPGATLALDFPRASGTINTLLIKMDTVVKNYGGKLYPAKDWRMTTQMLGVPKETFKRWSTFADPFFTSRLFQRLNESEHL